eukprot:GHVP01051432.1.p1 GENE.GHVP01051432.1~~GHVP01051432.1.p1  ORF type:complete len:217 (-),score=37.41 GHVP01051432.1:1452-2102(-)
MDKDFTSLSFFEERKHNDIFPTIEDYDESDRKYFEEQDQLQEINNKPKLLPTFIWNAMKNRNEDLNQALNFGCGRIEINGKLARLLKKILFALFLNLAIISPFILAGKFNQENLIRRVCHTIIYNSIFLFLPFVLWMLIENNKEPYVPPRPSKKKLLRKSDDAQRYFNPFENVEEFTKLAQKPKFDPYETDRKLKNPVRKVPNDEKRAVQKVQFLT